MSETILSKDEMTILLNQLPRKINVDYPFTNDHILSLEKEDKHYVIETQLETEETQTGSELWDEEKPSFSDYRQAFLSSNLITYNNLNEFLKEQRVYSNLRQKVVYAPDTNLFYNQFLSTGILKPEEIICVETVQKEITRMLNKKFNPNQISEIKQEVKYQKNALNNFINGRKKQSRLAFNLALQEYNQYSDQAYATIQSQNLVKDKEENDLILVEAVKQYRNTSNVYPVVLTCDRLMPDLCDAMKIPCFRFELPTTIHPETCSPEQLCRLVCNLAGALGVVKVNNLLVFGEFRGKQNPNEYKVQFVSGEIPLEIERDLEICRELMKLNITF